MNRVAPFAVGALAAAVGFYDLARNELGTAEATSFFIARLNWSDTWTSLSTSEANGSPFYLLLHFWSWVGDTEFVLRLLPLAFGVATTVLLYFLVSRLFGPMYGLGAGVLLALNAFFIAHSQNLRSYSMSAFLATLATYIFVRIVEDRPRWGAYAYIAVATVLVYAHFFGALVLAVHALSLLFLPRASIPLRQLVISWGTIAVLVLPLAFFILFQDVGQVDWIPALTGEKVLIDLGELVGLGGNVQLAAYALLVIGAAVVAARQRRSDADPRKAWAVALVVLWCVFPIASALAISLVKPLWQSRYMLVALPAMVTCAVVAIGALKRPALIGVAFTALAVLSASQVPGWYAEFNEPEWRLHADIVKREATDRDGLIFYAPTVIRTFGYHYGFYRDDIDHPGIIYPNKNWLGFSRTKYDIPLDRMVRDAQESGRVWLMLGADKDEVRLAERDLLIHTLKETCGSVNREWRDLDIILFEECDSTV